MEETSVQEPTNPKRSADSSSELLSANALLRELIDKVEQQNNLLQQQLTNQRSVRERVLAGLWTGLGTVLGATVLVSLLIYGLKPLSRVEWISPIVSKIVEDLETKSKAINSPPKPQPAPTK